MNAYFNMYSGTELKGKLDETFFSMLPIHSWVTKCYRRNQLIAMILFCVSCFVCTLWII